MPPNATVIFTLFFISSVFSLKCYEVKDVYKQKCCNSAASIYGTLSCVDAKTMYKQNSCCSQEYNKSFVSLEFSKNTGIGIPYNSAYYDYSGSFPMTECNTPREFSIRNADGSPSSAIRDQVSKLHPDFPMTLIKTDGTTELMSSFDAQQILDSAVPLSEHIKFYQMHTNCTMEKNDAFEYGRAELSSAIEHSIAFYNARGFPSTTSDRIKDVNNHDIFIQTINQQYMMIDFRKLQTHKKIRIFYGRDVEVVQTDWFDIDSNALEVDVMINENDFRTKPEGESKIFYDESIGILNFDVRNTYDGYFIQHLWPSVKTEKSVRIWKFECSMRFIKNDETGQPGLATTSQNSDYLVQFSDTCNLVIDTKIRSTSESPPPSPPPPPNWPQTEGCECSEPTDDITTSCMGTDADGNRVSLCNQETHNGTWTPSTSCRCGCGLFGSTSWSSGDTAFCYIKGNAESCPGAIASGWKPVYYITNCGYAPPPPPVFLSDDGFNRETSTFELSNNRYTGMHMVPYGNKRGLDVYAGKPLGGSTSYTSYKSHYELEKSNNDFSTWNETQTTSNYWQKLFSDFNTTIFHKMFVVFEHESLPLAGDDISDDIFTTLSDEESTRLSLNLLVGHEYFHNLQFSAFARNAGTEAESHAVVTEYTPGSVTGATNEKTLLPGLRLLGHVGWWYNSFRGYGWNGMRYFNSYLQSQPQYTPQITHETFADGQFNYYGNILPLWLKVKYDANMQVMKHIYHNFVDDMKQLGPLETIYNRSNLVNYDSNLGGVLASPSVPAYGYKRAVKTVLNLDIADIYTEYIITLTLCTNRRNVPEKYRMPEQIPLWLLARNAPLSVLNKFMRYGPSVWDKENEKYVFSYNDVLKPYYYTYFNEDEPIPDPFPSQLLSGARASDVVNTTMIPHWPKQLDGTLTSRAPYIFDDSVPHAQLFRVGLASLTSYVVTIPKIVDSVTITVDESSEVKEPLTGIVVLSYSHTGGLTMMDPIVTRDSSTIVNLEMFQGKTEHVRLIVSCLDIPVSRYYRRDEFDRTERPPAIYKVHGNFPSPPPMPPSAPPDDQITSLTPIVGGGESVGCAYAYSGSGYPNTAYTDFKFDNSDFVYGGILNCTKDGGVAMNPARYSLRENGHQYWIQENVTTPFGVYDFFAARIHGPIVFDGNEMDISASHVFYADSAMSKAEVESRICESAGWGTMAGKMGDSNSTLLCPDELSKLFSTWELKSECCKTVYSDWGTFEYQGILDCQTDRTQSYYDYEANMTEWWLVNDGTYTITIVKKNGGFYNTAFGANALQSEGYVGLYYEQNNEQTLEYWQSMMCQGYAFGSAFLPGRLNCPTQLSTLSGLPKMSCEPI